MARSKSSRILRKYKIFKILKLESWPDPGAAGHPLSPSPRRKDPAGPPPPPPWVLRGRKKRSRPHSVANEDVREVRVRLDPI